VRRLVFGLFALLFAAGTAQAAPHRHAILVGVSEYSVLSDAAFADWGPRNSVLLWRQLLMKRGYDDIQVLTDGLSAHIGVSYIPDVDNGITQTIPGAVLPTHANVQAAFRKLEATLAKEPDPSKDEVLIVLIGHGSTQPAAAGDRDQPDGRNQVFLVRDTGVSLDRLHYVNALLDTDAKPHLQALSAHAGTVWFVFDQCFAASMTYATAGGYHLRESNTQVFGNLSYDTHPVDKPKPAAPVENKDFAIMHGRPTGALHWPTNYIAFYAVSSKDEASTLQREPGTLAPLLRTTTPGFTALSYFTIRTLMARPNASFRQILVDVRRGYSTFGALKDLKPLVEGDVSLDRPALP